MRLTRPASLCPFASRRSRCILFSLPSSPRLPSLTLSLFLFDAFLCHPSNVHTLHPTSATGKERIVKQMGHRVEQRERINTRADTYRGRINHRKIMHMTTTERLGNGERVRVAPSCTSIRVFLPLSLSLSLSLSRKYARTLMEYGIAAFSKTVRWEIRHCVGDQTNTWHRFGDDSHARGCAEGAQGVCTVCNQKDGTHDQTVCTEDNLP